MKGNVWPRCPALGLADDPALYCTFPTEEHRCYREGKGTAIPWDKQELLCLSDLYGSCPAAEGPAAQPTGHRRPALYFAALAGVLLATAALLVWTGGSSAGPPPGTAPDELSAASRPLGPAVPPPPLTGTPALPATPLAQPAAQPGSAQAPTATPQPTATAARPLPAATPTNRPGTPRVHVVAPGETLSSISLRYDTSIEAIMRANGLGDRNFIWSGERLIIP